MTARGFTDRPAHWTMTAATRSFNNRSGLRHPAADTGMQGEYERQQHEQPLVHMDHAITKVPWSSGAGNTLNQSQLRIRPKQ